MNQPRGRFNLLSRFIGAIVALIVLVACTSMVAGAYSNQTAKPDFAASSTWHDQLHRPTQPDQLPPPRAKVTPHHRHTRVVWMKVTAYCPCKICCGPHAHGITASGKPVSFDHGKFVAADTHVLPFGTELSVPGYHGGQFVPVIDRGGAIRGHHLDVFFPTHQMALNWGVKYLPVTIED